MRKAGVLMPVSALPSRIGAGELGESAFHFIELLKENHVKIWQILPLNPVGYGNSPYQPYSSCAGDELYISLDALAEEGLLKEHPKEFQERATRVDYEAVRQYREPFLRTAFDVFTEKKGEEEKNVQVPYVKNQNGDVFQPVFTDVMELEKFTKGQKLRIAKVPFAKLPELLIDKAMAYAVNPLGFNLVLNREQLNKIIGLK